MKNFISNLFVFCAMLLVASCSEEQPPRPDTPSEWPEPIPESVEFVHAEFIYRGDDIGESYSDGWLIKLYTEMEIDELGNPIGPGSVMQLLLNCRYNEVQEAEPSYLVGIYRAPMNSGDFSPKTFVCGYMDYIDLPTGRVERPDASYYGEVAAGSTDLDVDLLDEGYVQIRRGEADDFVIEGILVGRHCLKRYFSWQGEIEVSSEVVRREPNSTLTQDLHLEVLVKGLLQDRGDYFGLGDESCRAYLLYLATEGIEFEWGHPTGTGEVMRLELLVPWGTVAEEGIPEGSYPMLVRNADTSIDRTALTPYHAIPGLPDQFSHPYWSGCWYVSLVDGVWGESYARIDDGQIEVSRTAEGATQIRCQLTDSSQPAFAVGCEVELAASSIEIF